jgi:hypothetical protein
MTCTIESPKPVKKEPDKDKDKKDTKAEKKG